MMGMWDSLTDPDAIAAAFDRVEARFGGIDILVNNAGISSRESLLDYDPKNFDHIMELNVNAVFICSQAAARHMYNRGGGAIINTSSMVGQYGQPSGVGYPASK